MRDAKREAADRTQYVNLPADVEIHYCTERSPMPKEIGDRARQLKQLWIHDGAEETEESMEMDYSYVIMTCKFCDYTYGVNLGD